MAPFSDDRPEYEGYTRPNPAGCVVGVIVGAVVFVGIFVLAYLLWPALGWLAALPTAILLLIFGAAVYLVYRRSQQRAAERQAETAPKRDQFEEWLDEELAAQHGQAHAAASEQAGE